jgi:hypothetical protein
LDEFDILETARRASAFFNGLFDVVYGSRTLSWRRVGTSALTTVIAVLTAGIAASFDAKFHPRFYDFGILLLPFYFAANLIVDFISCSKTRWILGLATGDSLWKLGSLLILDTALTVAIYVVGAASFFLLMGFGDNALDIPLQTIKGNPDYAGPMFFVAAFATSILFYLFLLSSLAIRAIGLSRTRLMILLERLDRSDQLFKSVAIVLGALLVLVKGLTDLFTHPK